MFWWPFALRSNLDKARNDADELLSDLLLLKAEHRKAIYTLDDHYVTSEFTSFACIVRNLTVNCYSRPKQVSPGDTTRPESIPSRLQSTFAALSTDYEWYLGSKSRDELIESFIWRELIRTVFCLDAAPWAGQIEQAQTAFPALARKLYAEVINSGPLPVDEFHKWRAQTASFLIRSRFAESHFATSKVVLVKHFKDLLVDFQNPSWTEEEVSRSLANVIEEALQLASELVQCRAFYQIFMKSPEEHISSQARDGPICGMPMNSFMEHQYSWDKELPSTALVELIMSPALIKLGNAAGKHYDKDPLVFAKSRVICAGAPGSRAWEETRAARAEEPRPTTPPPEGTEGPEDSISPGAPDHHTPPVDGQAHPVTTAGKEKQKKNKLGGLGILQWLRPSNRR